jgi:hypothetical protein
MHLLLAFIIYQPLSEIIQSLPLILLLILEIDTFIIPLVPLFTSIQPSVNLSSVSDT